MGRRKVIYALLKGGFLTDDKAAKSWRVISFVVGLLLVMIWSGHSVDEKVGRIGRLNKRKRELRAEYIDTKTSLARMRLESSVKSKVKSMGLGMGDTAPQKIRLTIKK